MIYVIDAIIVMTCAVFFFWGGYAQHNFRRFYMPPLIALGLSLTSHIWWVGITSLPLIGVMTIGYGEKSILYKYLTDEVARAVWMSLAAIIIGLGAFLTGHLAWYFYFPYILWAGFLGATLRNLNQILGDLIFGAYLSSIIFLTGIG